MAQLGHRRGFSYAVNPDHYQNKGCGPFEQDPQDARPRLFLKIPVRAS